MKLNCKNTIIAAIALLIFNGCQPVQKHQTSPRVTEDFNAGWKFTLEEVHDAHKPSFDESAWRLLDVPHDWSIEGDFSAAHPATAGGGALPGGLGWYRKSFSLPEADSVKKVFIEFDGVYCNSDVWINGHHLGNRPNGYISFRYELSPYLSFGAEPNVIVVKVDNSLQPNARWYTGSGIYRNVRLVKTEKIFVDQWGPFVQSLVVNKKKAEINIQTQVVNSTNQVETLTLHTIIHDPAGNQVAENLTDIRINSSEKQVAEIMMVLSQPHLWSVDSPDLYKVISRILQKGKLVDQYETTFGIRSFNFDSEKGFFLNDEPVKILGVCNHHDLGSLGAAINTRALERQLELLKKMGVNAIRTAHNPPAPELLNLCDKMGFIVMDEIFDMWKKPKSSYDYHLYWDEWHERDLTDFILRDRNHPSVFIWSIGNEILEQWDSSGYEIAIKLAEIVRKNDPSRPITTGNNDPRPDNHIIRSGVLDLIGYNYKHDMFADFPRHFPGLKFIATETTSALATRGAYDMPSDSIKRWPIRWDLPFKEGNADLTCSAYDNCSTPWGSTHEESWLEIKKQDFLSGLFVWTGFDYLGEPTPYTWPARSSYFGIIDLAGFPKDAYYMYQSEWTSEPMLHIFPHWNWSEGQKIDIWAYSNCDEVELIVNGVSQGKRMKSEASVKRIWKLHFQPGAIEAIARNNGKEVLRKEIRTAGEAVSLHLEADRNSITADGYDLAFITATIRDANGNIVPGASQLIHFETLGSGKLVGVDNGSPLSHRSMKGNQMEAMHGKCLVIIQADRMHGTVEVTASAEGLRGDSIIIKIQ